MTQRNENSVLFSLGHLQQMALASAGQARFSSPARAVRTPSTSQPFTSGGVQEPPLYFPATAGSSPMLVAHRPTWPRWLAPVVIGMGALFLVFLVLAIAVALRAPQQVLVAPAPVAAPVVAPVVAPPLPPPPATRATATAPLPTVVETTAQPTEAVSQPTPALQKRAMVTKRRARRSRWARRTRTRRRHHARASHHRARSRVARSAAYQPARKLGDRELDDILNAASR